MFSPEDWKVLETTKTFFQKVLHGHKRVHDFSVESDLIYNLEMEDGNRYRVVLVYEYTLGLAAVLKLVSEIPNLDFIVTGANWNAYTQEAKEYGEANDLGIFILNEFIAALYSRQPKSYVKKDADGKPVYHFRSA